MSLNCPKCKSTGLYVVAINARETQESGNIIKALTERAKNFIIPDIDLDNLNIIVNIFTFAINVYSGSKNSDQ